MYIRKEWLFEKTAKFPSQELIGEKQYIKPRETRSK